MVNKEKIKKNKTTEDLLEFGILNIDKPSGPTSFNVSDLVRKTLNSAGIKARKTSHFGTLDPKVTGVLPVALNRACKLTGFFIGEDKEYVGIMRTHKEVSIGDINKAIAEKFTGMITQLPPVKSRVKRQEREREIKSFEIIEKDGQNILFKVVCAGGTYIRKLVHDLGDYLKTGAHMLELRRVRAGIFNEDDKEYPSVNLYDLEKAIESFKKGDEKPLREIIIPGEIITELYPVVQVKEKYADKLLHGSPLHYEFLKGKKEAKDIEKFCAFSGETFIGIYKVTSEGEIFARPEFVLQPINLK
ncbi:MAG: RNA-guided pseudouridylation complex pseudouridine synthase subunit Cbf5 [Candidatus Pacearchaeota archaeon]